MKILYSRSRKMSGWGWGGEVYLFIFHQRLEKRICDQLHVAPVLICMFSFSENYNLVSSLIKSLCPYGSILSELNLGLLLCHLLL